MLASSALESSLILTSILDPIQMRTGPEKQRLAGHRGGSQEAVVQRVFRQFLKLSAGLDDGGLSFLAEKVNAVLGQQGRSRVIAAEAFAPHFLAGERFDTASNPAVVDADQQVIGELERRLLWDVASAL